jgi:2'-5' RNA ligase
MAELPPTETKEDSVPVLMKVYDFIEELPDEIIYQTEDESHGKENWPHITILYGLKDGSCKAAEEILKNYTGKIKATLGKISKFKNEEFDVLKIDVTSDDLEKLNSELKKLPNENKYPKYHAHVTLAYVKKGEGDEFVGNEDFDGLEVEIDKVIYSDEDRKHTRILEENGGYEGQGTPSGWAATFNGTSQNFNKFAGNTHMFKKSGKNIIGASGGNRYSAMNGNTILNSAPYETLQDSDLDVEGIDRDELFTGIRYELKQQLQPNKELAKEIAVNNLKEDPNYYSSLQMTMPDKKITYEERVKQVGNIINEMMVSRTPKTSIFNSAANDIVQAGIKDRVSGRGIKSITDIMNNKTQ